LIARKNVRANFRHRQGSDSHLAARQVRTRLAAEERQQAMPFAEIAEATASNDMAKPWPQ